MINKINTIEEYFDIQNNDARCKSVGLSDYAPLILMVNDNMEIVKELTKNDNFKWKCNLLGFLDATLSQFRKYRKEFIGDQKSVLNDILYILNAFNEKEDKWSITGEQFSNYVCNTYKGEK